MVDSAKGSFWDAVWLDWTRIVGSSSLFEAVVLLKNTPLASVSRGVASEELRSLGELVCAVLADSETGVLLFDAELQVLASSESVRGWLGSDAIGETIAESDCPELFRAIQLARAEGRASTELFG